MDLPTGADLLHTDFSASRSVTRKYLLHTGESGDSGQMKNWAKLDIGQPENKSWSVRPLEPVEEKQLLLMTRTRG